MSLSTSKPVVCRIASVSGPNGSQAQVSKVKMVNRQAHPPLQVKGKEKPLLQESSTTASRREIMQLTAASIGLLSLLVPGAAEARTRNASLRQKILDKFELLRQKAGLSKPKDEAQENKPKAEAEAKEPKAEAEAEAEAKNPKDQEKKAEVEAEAKNPKDQEKKHATAPKNEAPALPSILNDKLVETNLP